MRHKLTPAQRKKLSERVYRAWYRNYCGDNSVITSGLIGDVMGEAQKAGFTESEINKLMDKALSDSKLKK